MSAKRHVKVLIGEQTIAQRTEAMAREIAAQQPSELLVVAILKGSFMFAADLIRALHRAGLEPQVEFMHLSSYLDGTVSTGQVKILRDIDSDVRGRDVYSWNAAAPKAELAPGETVIFRTRLAAPPDNALRTVIRFASAAETERAKSQK